MRVGKQRKRRARRLICCVVSNVRYCNVYVGLLGLEGLV